MQENPVITDWVHGSGGSTEGTLGRWLAQRQAALRGLLAAGARSTRFVSSVRADFLLSTSRATENFFWKPRVIGNKDRQLVQQVGEFPLRLLHGALNAGEPSHF